MYDETITLRTHNGSFVYKSFLPVICIQLLKAILRALFQRGGGYTKGNNHYLSGAISRAKIGWAKSRQNIVSSENRRGKCRETVSPGNMHYLLCSSAWRISSRISCAFSSPTEIRIRPGVIPTFARSASVSLACVVLDG
jgi:hypothetical protein